MSYGVPNWAVDHPDNGRACFRCGKALYWDGRVWRSVLGNEGGWHEHRPRSRVQHAND